MKKIIASTTFIALFATYTLYLHGTNTVSATNVETASAASSQTTSHTASNSNTNTTHTATIAQATPADIPRGQYKDGTYTGTSADAFYGNVQVRVTVSGGKISNVAILDYPQDRDTSRMINSQALPELKQEVIAAQSAQIDGVSGATDTSEAFIQSLSSALSSAKA